MKLWLIQRDAHADRQETYDAKRGYVIRAETEQEARRMASAQHSDEGEHCWWLETTSVTEIRVDGPAMIILTDFNAG